MLPDKELERLVQALQNTPEYARMRETGEILFGNAVLYRRMLEFELEQSRLENNHAKDQPFTDEMKKLREEYKDLFEHADTKNFVDAISNYREIVESCLQALEKTFEI